MPATLNPLGSRRTAALDEGRTHSPSRLRAHRRALDGRVQQQVLAPLLSVAAGYYLLLAILHPLFVSGSNGRILSLMAGGTALTAGILRFLYGRRPFAPVLAYPLSMTVGVLALLNSHVHLFLTGELWQTTNVLMLVVGAGLILGRWGWFLGASAVAVGGWLAGTWTMRADPVWTHYLIAMASAMAIASVAVLSRRRVIELLSGIHLQDRRVAAALRRAHAASRASDEAKGRFLATMSHELRTPLQGVMGGSALLRIAAEEMDSTPLEPPLAMIEQSSDHLLRLMDDLIQASRAGQGELTLKMERVDLSDLCRRVSETFQRRVTEKRQTLTCDAPEHPVQMVGDPVRLAQVLTKLLDNAVKFTPDDGCLGLRLREEDDAVRIAVWDEGIGIAPVHVERLGEMFFQVDSSRTRNFGGTGTGLALATHLIQLHHGHLEIDSTPGEGSVFSVTLPRSQDEV